MKGQNVFLCLLILAIPPAETGDKPDLLYQHLSALPEACSLVDS